MRRIQKALALAVVALLAVAPTFAQGKLSARDAATADGSLRVGLHNGKIYGILTSTDSGAVLNPDSWASEDESKNWNLWLVDFDNELFTKWSDAAPSDGQQTVQLRIMPDRTFKLDAANFFPSSLPSEQHKQFRAAITTSIEQALKSTSPMPSTKNPLKEVRLALTFMRDPKVVPFYGREQLGFMTVLTPDGKNVIVHGRMKEGRAPGIQIISDNDGGTIQVTEDAVFRQKLGGATEASF
jgi:hypothetical protein